MFTFLVGINLSTLLKIFSSNQHRVDSRSYIFIIFHFLFAVLNSMASFFEKLIFEKKISTVSIKEEPVFILGHWRSGTTYLQYLLSKDSRLYSPSTFECLFPHNFSVSKFFFYPLFSLLIPKKRVQDNLEGGINLPNEDEIALAQLTGESPYLEWSFPKENRFEKFLAFENQTLSLKSWEKALIYFIKKLSLKYKKRILLKSPTHTARVDKILKIFPNAKFIHIHRDPYDVYKSTLHLFEIFEDKYIFLQGRSDLNKKEKVIKLYQDLYNTYLEHYPKYRDKILSFSYEDFLEKPGDIIKSIYSHIGIELDEKVKNELNKYIRSKKKYVRGKHKELSEDENDLNSSSSDL